MLKERWAGKLGCTRRRLGQKRKIEIRCPSDANLRHRDGSKTWMPRHRRAKARRPSDGYARARRVRDGALQTPFVPANAGTQSSKFRTLKSWPGIPAFAGMNGVLITRHIFSSCSR